MGGGHENERRAGTENLPVIVGLVEAMERFVLRPVFAAASLQPLRARLLTAVEATPGAILIGSREKCLANTVSFVVEGADSFTLMAGLDLEGVCASSGSACSAGSLEPSHVISALGVQRELANALVRLSLGRNSTLEEAAFVADVLPQVVRRAQTGQKGRGPV